MKKFLLIVLGLLLITGCTTPENHEKLGGSIYEIGALIDSSGNLTSPISTTTGAFSSTLSVSGASTQAAITASGLITANSGLTLGAGDDLIGSATSDITINTNKFTVAGATGNTVIAGTLTQTGAIGAAASITLGAGADLVGSATSDITINTDKFTVAGATGNTIVAGTFGITAGDATLTLGDVILTDGRFIMGTETGGTCSSGLVIDLAVAAKGILTTVGETNTACAISFTNGTAGELVILSHDYNGTGIITFADVTGFDAAFAPVDSYCVGIDAGVTAASGDHFYLQGVMTSATEIMITGCTYFDS